MKFLFATTGVALKPGIPGKAGTGKTGTLTASCLAHSKEEAAGFVWAQIFDVFPKPDGWGDHCVYAVVVSDALLDAAIAARDGGH